MPDLNLGEYPWDDVLRLTGIPSVAHPAAEGGGTYVVPSLPADEGAQLQRFMRLNRDAPDKNATAKQRTEYAAEAAAAAKALQAFLGDDEDLTLERKLLGAAYQQMLDDQVSQGVMARVVELVITHVTAGPDVTKLVVAQAMGEAKARAERADSTAGKQPASSKPAGSSSSPESSGSATPPTRKPRSTRASGTSARKTPAKKAAKKAV